MIIRSFPKVNRPEYDVDHQPPSRVVVKERLELYLHSPSGLSRPVLGLILPLPLLLMEIPAVYCENHIKYMRKLTVRRKNVFCNAMLWNFSYYYRYLNKKKKHWTLTTHCVFVCHTIFQERKKKLLFPSTILKDWSWILWLLSPWYYITIIEKYIDFPSSTTVHFL